MLLTLYGFLLAAMPGSWDWLARWRHVSLAVGTAVVVAGLASFESGLIAHDGIEDHFFANVFTWLVLMAFLGYGRRHLSFGNRVLAWARESSYPIYILHQTIIVGVAYFIVPLAWRPWTKYVVVLGATMVFCVAIYELLVRRFPAMRFLFGMKPAAARLDGRSASLRGMSERLEQIEVKIAYLEQANAQLSDVVYQQRQEIESLRQRLVALTDRLESAQSPPTQYTAEDEKPPHY